jgi:hypothetical protein
MKLQLLSHISEWFKLFFYQNLEIQFQLLLINFKKRKITLDFTIKQDIIRMSLFSWLKAGKNYKLLTRLRFLRDLLQKINDWSLYKNILIL